MRTFFLPIAALSLLSQASARITSIAAPSTVAGNADVSLTIVGTDYIQSIQDVAISFGITPTASAHAGSLGELLSSKFLGPDDSNFVGNMTHIVHIPYGTPNGSTTLTGSLFSLIGAELSPNIENFVVEITIGDSTSSTYVSS